MYVTCAALLGFLLDWIFGGITGDLAGFCISLSELIALACAAFGGLMV